MRIISQNGLLDVPYELIAFSPYSGNLGHSSVVAFYSDGDGDFRPNFDIDIEYEKKKGYWSKDVELSTPEVIFDAG